IALDLLSQQTLTPSTQTATVGLQTSQAMLYHFVLSFDNQPTATDVGVAMQLYDQNNNVVLTLVSLNRQTVSLNVLLGAGTDVGGGGACGVRSPPPERPRRCGRWRACCGPVCCPPRAPRPR